MAISQVTLARDARRGLRYVLDASSARKPDPHLGLVPLFGARRRKAAEGFRPFGIDPLARVAKSNLTIRPSSGYLRVSSQTFRPARFEQSEGWPVDHPAQVKKARQRRDAKRQDEENGGDIGLKRRTPDRTVVYRCSDLEAMLAKLGATEVDARRQTGQPGDGLPLAVDYPEGDALGRTGRQQRVDPRRIDPVAWSGDPPGAWQTSPRHRRPACVQPGSRRIALRDRWRQRPYRQPPRGAWRGSTPTLSRHRLAPPD